jgi:hypothetical protein
MTSGSDGTLVAGFSADENEDNEELRSKAALIAWLNSLFTSKNDISDKLATVIENVTENINAKSREAESNFAAALLGEIRIKLIFIMTLYYGFVFFFIILCNVSHY